MSTTLYLRCVTHDPYIQSNEIGSNLSYLDEIRGGIGNRKIIVENMRFLEDDVYDLHMNNTYKRNLWWFLFNHPDCELQIWDEYNKQHALIEKPARATDYDPNLAKVIDEVIDRWCNWSEPLRRDLRDRIIEKLKDRFVV